MPRTLWTGLGALIRSLSSTLLQHQPAGGTGTPASHIQLRPRFGRCGAPALSATPAGPLQIDIDLIEPSPYQPAPDFAKKPG